MKNKKHFILLISLAVFFLFPKPAFAHAFGQLYNLPVPFWLYLYGGAATILVSFLIIGYFFNKSSKKFNYPTSNLSRFGFFRLITSKPTVLLSKIFSVTLLFFTIISGYVGSQEPQNNINMTLFWIFFVLVFTYFVALIGTIWEVVNPWKVVSEIVEKIFKLELKGLFHYPEFLSYYPALILYIIFIWIELFADTVPMSLAVLLIEYSLVTFMGVMFFGSRKWFYYCDFFSVFFRLLGKISIFEYKNKKVYLRPPFVGLLQGKAEHFSLVLFIIFMLSSTAFDGFHSTKIFYNWINVGGSPIADWSDAAKTNIQTASMLLSLVFFMAFYLLLMWLAKVITKSKFSVVELSIMFVYAHIPLAFVYHVAHYYALILIQGQNIIRLISDPFGREWDLFGTGNYSINLAVIDMNFIWHSQVALILFGHIVGVYISHIIALQVFPNHKKALLSQVPMLILMVIYTMVGLWVLAQPIVAG